MSNIILSAIAYAHALTAKRANVINSEDHNAASRLLRDVLKEALPSAQEKSFVETLRNKSAIRYRAKAYTLVETEKFLASIEKLATWAEEELL